MISQLLGSFLAKKELISAQNLENVLEKQKKNRVKLGLIAVSEKMLSEEDAKKINRLQSALDKRFGDIAVEKGYLTKDQVDRLLGLQGNQYLSFCQALVDEELLTFEQVEEALEDYRVEMGFTRSDIEKLKGGDVDDIVPLFIPSSVSRHQTAYVLVCVRTLLRLIDSSIYIDKAYITDHLDTDFYALQSIDGDAQGTIAFIAKGKAILPVAETFGEEEFGDVDVYALDAVAEFINCVNGMFASDFQSEFEIDMLPPDYKVEKATLTGRLLVLPVYVKGERFDIISSFGEFINVN